jgi:hypothetical protein
MSRSSHQISGDDPLYGLEKTLRTLAVKVNSNRSYNIGLPLFFSMGSLSNQSRDVPSNTNTLIGSIANHSSSHTGLRQHICPVALSANDNLIYHPKVDTLLPPLALLLVVPFSFKSNNLRLLSLG